MARLGKVTKYTHERKRYTVAYDEWVDTGETVALVEFSVTGDDANPVAVDAHAISEDGLTVAFFVSGGDDGETYEVLITATTSGGQTKEDTVLFAVVAA